MMKQHRFSAWLAGFFALAFGMGVSTSAFAMAYSYSSPNYASAGISGNGTPPVYTTAMHIAGSIATASPLPANMPLTEIGPSGSNLIQTFSFNDGLHSYTLANTRLMNFDIAADSAGNISTFSMTMLSPLPPNTIGQKMNGVLLNAGAGLAEAISGGVCSVVNGTGQCTALGAVNNTDSLALIGAPIGTFTTSASPPAGTLTAVPNPAQQGQAVVLTATTGSTLPGTVTFSDGTTVLCNTVPLVSGTATCSTSSLSVGSHTITGLFAVGGIAVITFSVTATVTIAAIPPPTPAPTLGAWALIALAAFTMLMALVWQRRGMRR
ncbi:Ig-like domain-containing protein [Dokdonella soli]|uniref:Bacterial Ig-like domain-containing protein n=1 Tax=Dokdonella soli TaxID=529810 RepID=A0ABN1IXF0_9GAMM